MKIILILIIAISMIMPVMGYIADVEPEPDYSYGNFLKPLKVVQLEIQEKFEIIVIVSMLAVNLLKVYGTFLALRMGNPAIKFNPGYLVSAVLGVFVGYVAFMQTDPVMETTYISLFMHAGFYALGANLMVDFTGKLKGKLS